MAATYSRVTTRGRERAFLREFEPPLLAALLLLLPASSLPAAVRGGGTRGSTQRVTPRFAGVSEGGRRQRRVARGGLGEERSPECAGWDAGAGER